MKKTILASVGSVLLFALTPAFAADMPMPMKGPPAPYMAPFYNWTGFYVGVNGGWAFGQSRWSGGGASSPNFNIDGPVIGGTLGYNMQMGAIVAGIEGDFDWSNIRGTSHSAFCGGAAGGCTTRNNWLGTGRLRIGYAFDRWLPYATGGAAFGDIKATSPGGSTTRTNVGWTIGGGVEWGFLANWTAKAEYLYVDLGNGRCSGACSGGPPSSRLVREPPTWIRAGANRPCSALSD
jgi:outer membrane immunogenic protein